MMLEIVPVRISPKITNVFKYAEEEKKKDEKMQQIFQFLVSKQQNRKIRSKYHCH